jgi:glycosyltransferase involved in cell wall biosynthesis
MNVLRFLRWMKARGWRVGLYGNPDTRMYREARNFGIQVGPIVSNMHSGDLVNARRLSKMVRHDGVRWLITHRSQDLFLGVFARLFSGNTCRLIFHQHMHIGKNKKDLYHRWLYRQIDAFVTPVPWLAERVREKTSVPKDRLHIIPRGIEVARFTDAKPEKVAARSSLGLPPRAPLIGLIGRLDPKKGQDTVIKALARVHAAGYPAHLLLVGDQSFDEGDKYAASIRSLVEDTGMTDYVHFRSHRPDVETAYAALDIFVLASKSECYGMVTIEALTSGLPVVGTNDGGTVSLIDPGRNGLLVTPQDVAELSEALVSLLKEPEATAQMGLRARQEARVKFAHTTQCKAWEGLLEQLARNPVR